MESKSKIGVDFTTPSILVDDKVVKTRIWYRKASNGGRAVTVPVTVPQMIECAIRSIQSVADCAIFSVDSSKNVEVEFCNGIVHNFSAEYLRTYSPAVDTGCEKLNLNQVISGRHHVGIMSMEPVGNYGVRYFYHLDSNKFTLMRNYDRTLKKHGLSRDPPQRK